MGGFAVQRLRSPDGAPVSYTVVAADGLPVEPVEAFLAWMASAVRYAWRRNPAWLTLVDKAYPIADRPNLKSRRPQRSDQCVRRSH